MAIPFGQIGQGRVVNMAAYRAKFEADRICTNADNFADAMSPIGPALNRTATAPWRVIPGFSGQAAVYDAEGHLLYVARHDLAERAVNAVNQIEVQAHA